MTSDLPTRRALLDATKTALIESGYARLSTRSISQLAGVPLSQIHYHFGNKKGLVLELLAEENRRLLSRQAALYDSAMPMWKQWEQACDFLDDDLESGYVRVLQEMTAAGWSDEEIASAVRVNLTGWMSLLAETADRAQATLGSFGSFTSAELAVLAGAPFLGVEGLILLGFREEDLPMRAALRKIGEVLRSLEERQ